VLANEKEKIKWDKLTERNISTELICFKDSNGVSDIQIILRL